MTHEKNRLFVFLDLSDYFQESVGSRIVHPFIVAHVGAELGSTQYNLRSLSGSNCGRAQHEIGNYFFLLKKVAYGLRVPSAPAIQGAFNIAEIFVFPTRLCMAQDI